MNKMKIIRMITRRRKGRRMTLTTTMIMSMEWRCDDGEFEDGHGNKSDRDDDGKGEGRRTRRIRRRRIESEEKERKNRLRINGARSASSISATDTFLQIVQQVRWVESTSGTTWIPRCRVMVRGCDGCGGPSDMLQDANSWNFARRNNNEGKWQGIPPNKPPPAWAM
eukprot:768510-Hanusia_phi.AAC.2